jgi:hypothetical protein
VGIGYYPRNNRINQPVPTRTSQLVKHGGICRFQRGLSIERRDWQITKTIDDEQDAFAS